MFHFDEIIDRGNTNSMKYDAGPSIHPDLPAGYLPMWVADMDFACPQPILDAMKARIDRRILGYSIISDPEYYDIVVKWMKRRHGWDTSPSRILFSPGVVDAMHTCVEQLTSAGDGILLMTPSYSPFDAAIKAKGRTPVYCRLPFHDGHYSIDFADFEQKAAHPDTTLFFLCNPHNPTGRVWSHEELDRIAEICLGNNVFIVSDDIHADIVRSEFRYTPLATRIPGEKRLITLTAPSKTFNIAGNQLSNIIFEDDALAYDWRRRNVIATHPNPLSIDACKAAYTLCDDWVDALNEYLDGNFAYLSEKLRELLPKAVMSAPEGTYVAWIDLGQYMIPVQELKRRVSRNGLFIQYEDDFVAHGEGFVRINLACPRSLIDLAVDRLAASVR